jgi:hypothetical protein
MEVVLEMGKAALGNPVVPIPMKGFPVEFPGLAEGKDLQVAVAVVPYSHMDRTVAVVVPYSHTDRMAVVAVPYSHTDQREVETLPFPLPVVVFLLDELAKEVEVEANANPNALPLCGRYLRRVECF